MATNKLVIDFTAPATEGESISFSIAPSGVPITFIQTFRAVRDAVGETQIGATAEEQAANYYEAMLEDYGDMLGVSIDGTVVDVASRSGYTLSSLSNDALGADAELVSLPLVVLGINSNRYLINNPIILEIGTGLPTDFFRITLTNAVNNKTSGQITIYPDLTGSAQIDIAPYLKGLFDIPENARSFAIPDQPINTAAQVIVRVFIPSDTTTPSFSATKTFVRGGVATGQTNRTLPSNVALRPSEKLPVWAGYPTSEYYFDGSQIKKRLQSSINPDTIDFKRSKGCNEVYVEFLNQMGGYSYWLFESHEDNESNSNKGVFISNQQVEDLGNDADATLKVYSKIPQEYLGLIRDLIISPDIHIIRGDERIKVTSGRNNVPFDNVKTAQYVTINLNYHNRFNPSLLWSNSL